MCICAPAFHPTRPEFPTSVCSDNLSLPSPPLLSRKVCSRVARLLSGGITRATRNSLTRTHTYPTTHHTSSCPSHRTVGTLICAMSRSSVSKLVTEFCYARSFNNARGGGGRATRITTLFPSFLHKPSPQSPRFSTSRSPALAPPDHLDPKELHIFSKLVTELSPSRLEVCRTSDIG